MTCKSLGVLAVLSAIGLGAAVSQHAFAADGKILSPVSAWTLQPQGEGQNQCILGASYEDGLHVRLVAVNGKPHTLEMEFPGAALPQAEQDVPVRVSLAGGSAFDAAGRIVASDLLEIPVDGAPQFGSDFKRSPILFVKGEGLDYGLSLSGAAAHWSGLAACRETDAEALHANISSKSTFEKDDATVAYVSGAPETPSLNINPFPVGGNAKAALKPKAEDAPHEAEVIVRASVDPVAALSPVPPAKEVPEAVEALSSEPAGAVVPAVKKPAVEIEDVTQVELSQEDPTVIDTTGDKDAPIIKPVKTVTRIHTPKLKVKEEQDLSDSVQEQKKEEGAVPPDAATQEEKTLTHSVIDRAVRETLAEEAAQKREEEKETEAAALDPGDLTVPPQRMFLPDPPDEKKESVHAPQGEDYSAMAQEAAMKASVLPEKTEEPPVTDTPVNAADVVPSPDVEVAEIAAPVAPASVPAPVSATVPTGDTVASDVPAVASNAAVSGGSDKEGISWRTARVPVQKVHQIPVVIPDVEKSNEEMKEVVREPVVAAGLPAAPSSSVAAPEPVSAPAEIITASVSADPVAAHAAASAASHLVTDNSSLPEESAPEPALYSSQDTEFKPVPVKEIVPEVVPAASPVAAVRSSPAVSAPVPELPQEKARPVVSGPTLLPAQEEAPPVSVAAAVPAPAPVEQDSGVYTYARGEGEAAEAPSSALRENVNAKPVAKWSAEIGDSLRQVISMWSLNEGVELIWDADREFGVREAVRSSGSYEQSLMQLLDQYASAGARPVGELYVDPETKQKMLVVRVEYPGAGGAM